LTRQLQRVGGVRSLHRLPALLFEVPGNQLPDARIVVHYQDGRARQALVGPAERPPLKRSHGALAGGPGGDGKGEGAAPAWFAADGDRATMHLDQLAHDAQTLAGAAVAPGAAAVPLNELFEDHPLRISRDADTGVLDGDPDHTSRWLGDDFDVAALGELDSIGQQVDQDLLEAGGVTLDRRQAGRESSFDAKPLLLRERADAFQDRDDQRRQVDTLHRELHLARLDLAQIEDLVD